jgi:hypothetical protein
MTNEEKIATIHNVISDLRVNVQQMEDAQKTMDEPEFRENWHSAKLACEYITYERAHL